MKILFGLFMSFLLIQGCSSTHSIKAKNNAVKNIPQKKQIIKSKTSLPKKVVIKPIAKRRNTNTTKHSLYSASSSKSTATKRAVASPYVKKRIYTCSDISESQAYSLMRSGHTYLDRDGDGHPCEWGKKKINTYTPAYKSRCYSVGGYYRKSGTYVRGHTRCR